MLYFQCNFQILPPIFFLNCFDPKTRGTDKYAKLMISPENRAFFVDKVVHFVDKHGFDGLDIDYEPVSSEKLAKETDFFTALIK